MTEFNQNIRERGLYFYQLQAIFHCFASLVGYFSWCPIFHPWCPIFWCPIFLGALFSWCPIFLVPYFLRCPIFYGALFSYALYSGALFSGRLYSHHLWAILRGGSHLKKKGKQKQWKLCYLMSLMKHCGVADLL